MPGRDRLGREHVEGRRRDPAVLQGLDQGLRIDQVSPRQVDEDHAASHPAERIPIDQAARLGRRRAMQRDDVRLGQESLQVEGQAAGPADLRRVDGRVMDQEPAAERPQPGRDLPADPAEPHDPDREVAQGPHPIDRRRGPPIPSADAEAIGHDLAGRRQDEGQGMVRHLVDAVVGHVADRDAPGPRGLEVDVVHADPVSDDDPGAPHARDHARVEVRELGEHGIGVPDEARQVGGWPSLLPGDDLDAERPEDALLDLQVGERVVRDGHFQHAACSGDHDAVRASRSSHMI